MLFIILICISLIFSILSLYYIWAILFLRRGLVSLEKSGTPQGLSFSIVIAARNEEHTIGLCLEGIFNQTIPESRYNVILANDRSEDATKEIASKLLKGHPNFSIIDITSVPEGVSPKKHALSCAVKSARNEIIVFTDADCFVKPTWLETIDKNMSESVGMVQGITCYKKVVRINPFFYGLQAVDFLSHGIVSAAGIGAGLPLNSNANNLAFRREMFDSIDGYDSCDSVISGDDDLLLQKISRSKKWKIRYMTDSDSAVETIPTGTIREAYEQRKRWASKTVHYNIRQKIFLGGIFIFYIFTLISLFLGLYNPILFTSFAFMYILKIAGELIIMWPGTRIFKQKILRKYILPASLVQLPVVVFAVIMGVFGHFEWKGQRFRRKTEQ